MDWPALVTEREAAPATARAPAMGMEAAMAMREAATIPRQPVEVLGRPPVVCRGVLRVQNLMKANPSAAGPRSRLRCRRTHSPSAALLPNLQSKRKMAAVEVMCQEVVGAAEVAVEASFLVSKPRAIDLFISSIAQEACRVPPLPR